MGARRLVVAGVVVAVGVAAAGVSVAPGAGGAQGKGVSKGASEAHGPTVGCDDRSFGAFDGAPRTAADLRVGPLLLPNGGTAAAELPVDGLREMGWWKMPAILRQGRTVTLRIAWSHRRRAGWNYRQDRRAPRRGVPAALRRTDRTVTLVACEPGTPDSTVGGRPRTFWSGGIVFTHVPLCVPVEIRVDGRARPYRRTIRLGTDRCPATG